MKKSLLFIYFLFVSFFSIGQVHFDYTLKVFTEKEGLPDHSLRDIFFDRVGQMWLTTTSSGIAVFNGKQFNKIATEDGLSNNMTFRSGQTKDGAIWTATKNGISRISTIGKIDTFLTSSINDRSSYFTFIHIDNNNTVWAGGFSGLYKWNGVKFNKQQIPKVNRVLFGTSKNGVLYFASDAGLLSIKNNKAVLYDSSSGVLSKNIYRIFPINERSVLIGGFDGFYDFDPILKQSKKILTDKGETTSALAIEQLDDNSFLVSSGANNLFIYNGKDLTEIDVNLNDPVLDIKKDNFGNLYLVGKYLYQFKKNNFTKKQSVGSNIQGFTNYLLFDNEISVTYKDSLCYIFQGNQKLAKIQLIDEIITSANYKNSSLLIGTNKGTIYVYKQGRLRKLVSSNFVNAQPDIVHTIWWSKNGVLYIGRNYTLLKIDENALKVQLIQFPTQSTGAIFEIQDASNQSALVTTSLGLFTFKEGDTLLSRVNLPKISGSIVSVAIDRYGSTWFAEDGKGIGRIYKDSSIQYLTERNGLPYNDISRLIIDNNEPNTCYVVHIGGISKVLFDKNRIIDVVNVKYGDRGLPYLNQGISIVDNLLTFGSDGNFYQKTTPINIPSQQFVYLRHTDNDIAKLTNWKPISILDTLQLNKGGEQLNMMFNSLGDDNDVKLYLKYKLSGEDLSLVNTQELGLLALGYLNPGEYELDITFLSSPEAYSSIYNKHIKIIVPYFWYQTWYFKSIFFLLLVLLMYFIVDKLRQKKEAVRKRVFENQKVKLELENKVLKTQLNPHVVFNLLNNIQSRILFEEKDMAIESIGSLSSFLRTTLELSKKEEIYLSEEIAYVKSFISFRSKTIEGLTIDFVNELTLNETDGKVPSLLWQPLIENALNYCGSGQKLIRVRFFCENDFIVGVIENTIDSNKFNFVGGNGIRLVKERVALINTINGPNTSSFQFKIEDGMFKTAISISKKYVLYE